MKAIKTIVIAILLLSLLSCCIITSTMTYKINRSGEWSSVCHISEKGKQFIINNFGYITDTDQLISAIENYAVDNFQYNNNYDMKPIQSFDFDKYVFQDKGKSGVCFELSCFAKCCLVEVFKYQNKDAKIYVLDVRMPSKSFVKPTHSYNYIVEENRVLAFDLVCSLEGKNWTKEFSTTDIYSCAKSMGESPYNIY